MCLSDISARYLSILIKIAAYLVPRHGSVMLIVGLPAIYLTLHRRFWRFPGKWRPSPAAALVFSALVSGNGDAEVRDQRDSGSGQTARASVNAAQSVPAPVVSSSALAADLFR